MSPSGTGRRRVAVALGVLTFLVSPGLARAGGDLWLYGSAGTGDQQRQMATGTNPSIGSLANGYELAYIAAGGSLNVAGTDVTGTLPLSVTPGTSPAIAGLLDGSWVVAASVNGGDLITDGGPGFKDWQLGMAAGTSPAITGLFSDAAGYEAAIEANTDELWAAGTGGGGPTGDAMAPHTNPAITAVGGSWEMAFQSNAEQLWTSTATQPNATTFGMSPGTSPAMVVQGSQINQYETAFGAYGSNRLWVYGGGSGQDTGLTMAAGTNPAIAYITGGGFEVAFQGSNGDLWVYGAGGTGDTGLGMAPGSSPAIAGQPNGGYEVAFQARPLPAPPVATTPATTPLPVSTAPRQLRVKVLLTWTWNRARTRLRHIRIGRLPADAQVSFMCRGRGCPDRRRHTAGVRHLRQLERAQTGRVYRAGDRLYLRITAAGYRPLRAELIIRNGARPAVKLL